MKNYIRLCLWALAVLWQQKTISKTNRLRLWRKSINLFVCLAAFADKEKPLQQLRGAMVCALLSAIYDYETDWVPTDSVESSIYKGMLFGLVSSPNARQIAFDLFKADRFHNLSTDGLERGSVALAFYREVIGSHLLSTYSADEIASFGRSLRIVDDLLDLDEDKEAGHTNCLLTPGRNQYLTEVREFIGSKFFRILEEHSAVFLDLKCKCSKFFCNEKPKGPTTQELIRSCRSHTGVFAFALTLIGFKLQGQGLIQGIPIAIVFLGVTLSIMVWNDLIDRNRDVKKGKVVATLHYSSLRKAWVWISGVTLVVILGVALFQKGACLCLIVWFLGLFYSVAKLSWPWNNILVAFCSASPVLAGAYCSGNPHIRSLLVFGIVFTTIITTEAIKDIQDMEGDLGYKDTLATRSGHLLAIMVAVTFSYIPAGITVVYPNMIVKVTALWFALMMFPLARSFTRRSETYTAERLADWFLGTLLIALLCT